MPVRLAAGKRFRSRAHRSIRPLLDSGRHPENAVRWLDDHNRDREVAIAVTDRHRLARPISVSDDLRRAPGDRLKVSLVIPNDLLSTRPSDSGEVLARVFHGVEAED